MTSAATGPHAVPVEDPMVSVLGRSVPYKYIVAFVYVSALFVDILDVTIVNVALPTLGREMRSDAIEWIVLGYTLSLAVWIPASGWLGDRVGTKRIFLTAVGLFVGASMLCGLAQNIEQLIAFRVLQGVGGGMLTPVGVAMLYRAYPPAERAKAATVLIIPTVLAPATGPVLGGLLVTHLHWRWIFFINVPIGLMAFVVAARYLREHREPSAKHFDWRGFVLSGAGLALVVFALSEGPRAGWTSGLVLITGVIGVVAFVLMVWVELTVPNPMLDLRLLREPIFRVTNIVSMLAQGAFLGVIFLMPLYLQDLRGVSALESGLTTFPQAFGVMAASQISGRIYPRIGPRRLIMAGMAAGTVSGLLFGLVDLGTSMWAIRGLMLLRGFCLGIAFVPMQAASYAQIQPQDNGRASSIFATGRQMAVSLSIAALATVVTTVVPFDEIGLRPDDALDAFRLAFLVCAGFSALAVIASTRIRDELAANTMVRRR